MTYGTLILDTLCFSWYNRSWTSGWAVAGLRFATEWIGAQRNFPTPSPASWMSKRRI